MRWRALLVLLAALPAVGQDAMNVSPCRMDGTDCSAAGASYATLDAPSGAAANDVAVFLGSPLRLSYLTAGSALQVLRVNAAGTALEFADPAGGGITNGAGENVLAKGDAGGDLVASALVEATAGQVATSAGTALGLTATAPAATTGASQAGKDVTITASPAVASTDTAGAAAGGNVTITAGAAARNASGNANGGAITFLPGAGIGTGIAGTVIISDSTYGIQGTSSGFAIQRTTTAENRIVLYAGTTASDGVRVGSAMSIGWASSNVASGAFDTFMRRRGAANPAWGAAHDSAPVAYTHSLAADATAGSGTSNVSGANAIITPGNGKGNAAGSTLTIQTPTPVASGTGAQTLTTRLVAKSTGINIPGLAEYADNAAAVSGGLVTGDLYRTSTGVLMVVLP